MINFRMPYNIQFTQPSLELFQLPPSNEPLTLQPPPNSIPYAPPFSIPESLYRGALDPKLPITVAAVYVFSISIINAINSKRGNKPWAVSKTRIFSLFVVLHNVLLAVYSGWTFLGMWETLAKSIPSPYEKDGLVGFVDALCKPHGSQGLGGHINYNSTLAAWVAHSTSISASDILKLADTSGTGRLWSEGLAFYGWIFYMSKFYELLDTFIIVSKGKRSATLQTYHHTGAMLCMWSGIRYMSPPIWMFVFINSAIHTLMYTYYTFSALGVPVPGVLKSSLTSLQILQFLVGSSYAALHSFITYYIPVEVSYTKTITEQIAPSVIYATGVANKMKNILVNALGRPNMAPSQMPISKSTELTRIRTEYQAVPCIDTSGETFAIWLNIIYLTPLTVLFVRFFIKTYLTGSNKCCKKAGISKDQTNKDQKEK
ncbi:hypothetical protein K3495_g877 [Podosphaera aphanis]|nr:hypothetical protein K3495_g877 [Podosphaera aphanis]